LLSRIKYLGNFLSNVQIIARASRTLTVLQNLLILRRPSQKFWSWEVYGLGIALKNLLQIRPNKVIAFGSDHGVMLETEPSKEEILMASKIFVTWSAWRLNLEFPDGRKVVLMRHPWIGYRKKLNLKRSKNARGTLAFVPHSVPDLKTETFSLESYIKSISELPEKFHPITFCFHVHDLNRENIRLARKLRIRIQTVGAVLSPHYVRRFYKLIGKFQFATSPTLGSQLFYCEEFGLEFFIHDPLEKHQRSPLSDELPIDLKIASRIQNLFTLENIGKNEKLKREVVSQALGLEVSETFPREALEILFD
jgi:GR25 family glycosyltransferase involved in LPS biosynthesis